jgi:hypothetical protein
MVSVSVLTPSIALRRSEASLALGRSLSGHRRNPKRPLSAYFGGCSVIAKNTINLMVLESPVEAWPGRELMCQMISIYARETTLSHVLAQAGSTTYTGVVFHGLPGKRQNPPPSFKKE